MSDTFAVTQLPQDGAELKLQYERILQVLDLVIKKIKICVCLPNFLEHSPTILGNVAECEYIRGTCAKYLRQHSSSLANFKSGDGTMINNTNPKAAPKRKTPLALDSLKIDPDMTHIVEILYKNRKVKNVALEKYAHLSKAKYVHITDALKMMHQIMKEKSEINAIEQIMREKSLKRAFRENIEMRAHLQAITREGERQKRDFQMQVDNKKATLRQLQQEIVRRNANLREEVKNVVERNEAGLREDREVSKLRQQELALDAKAAVNQFETLVSQHMNRERKLRAKRLKTETQLAGWLSKYDFDMGDRQTELDSQLAGFKEECDTFNALVAKLNELERTSATIMQEKAEEDKEQRIAVNFFSRKRAAKIIQRYYRAYRERLRKSKKAKKK